MTPRAVAAALAAIALPFAAAGCSTATNTASAAAEQGTIPVTITTAAGKKHVFTVEVARTPAEQERGLMYRTDIAKDGGMIFTPYPAEGGPPREASFWMKNTPSSLDIIYIRADGTIARIAENTVPFSEMPIASGEPVAAVLEILGGRAAELGIGQDDRVSWKK
jgi:uncharacterized membrane protein (UPF0127 family)